MTAAPADAVQSLCTSLTAAQCRVREMACAALPSDEEIQAQFASTRDALGLLDAFEPPTVVTLVRDVNRSIGISIEYMATHGLPEIAALDPHGPSKASGQTQLGDVITTVNGIDAALGPDKFMSALSASQETVELVIRRRRVPSSSTTMTPRHLVSSGPYTSDAAREVDGATAHNAAVCAGASLAGDSDRMLDEIQNIERLRAQTDAAHVGIHSSAPSRPPPLLCHANSVESISLDSVRASSSVAPCGSVGEAAAPSWSRHLVSRLRSRSFGARGRSERSYSFGPSAESMRLRFRSLSHAASTLSPLRRRTVSSPRYPAATECNVARSTSEAQAPRPTFGQQSIRGLSALLHVFRERSKQNDASQSHQWAVQSDTKLASVRIDHGTGGGRAVSNTL